MDLTVEERIVAPRAAVWAALNDPEILRRAIPGAETVTRLSDDELEATVAVRVGPVSARFRSPRRAACGRSPPTR